MGTRTSGRIAAVGALLLVVPSVFAVAEPGIHNPIQSTPTTLYFHLMGTGDFAVNTQKPDASFTGNFASGTTANSLGCVPPGSPADTYTRHEYTTYYGPASPRFVNYNRTENGHPPMSLARGLGFEVVLDKNATFTTYWAVSTYTGNAKNGAGQPNNAVIPVPNVVVRATMRTGDGISIGNIGYNTGDIIAQGQSTPTTLLGDNSFAGTPASKNPQVTYQTVDGLPVYFFAVPMTFIGNATVPSDKGFNVRIDVFQSLPTCDMSSKDEYVMTNFVRAHTSPDLRPRMEMSVMDPLRIAYVHPQFIGDDIVVHTAANSPWGNYDVATPGGLTFNITGPDGPVTGATIATVSQRLHEHDYNTNEVDTTFVWPYKEAGAKDGTYTFSMDVQNLQGTSRATAIAQFHIGKDLYVTSCGQTSVSTDSRFDGPCAIEHQDGLGNVLQANVNQAPGVQLLATICVLSAVAFATCRKEATQ